MLVYTTNQSLGISRKGAGRGFYYLNAEGAKVEDAAIPPAYKDVWICPMENGHLQATGHDQRKRKQYRHPMEGHAPA